MADPLSAGIMAGASLLGGITGGKGASKAAKIQADAYKQGIAEQQRQFNQTQANEAPFLQAGTNALSGANGLQAGLGLQGAPAQQAFYDAIQNSPAFKSTIGIGNNAILQNAAATGGLRGGNINNPLVNGSLPNYDQAILAQLVAQQLGGLGGLVNTGQAAAGGLAAAGQNSANAISGLLAQQGGANATASAAPLAGFASGLQGAANIFGNYFGQNSGLSGIAGGGWSNALAPSAAATGSALDAASAALDKGFRF